MNDFLAILKALADETRFKIINMLLTHNYCVGALAYNLGVSKAAVSQHLQILRKAGLVKGEKRGYWTHYAVEKDLLILVAEELKKITAQQACHEYMCHHESSRKNNSLEGRGENMCSCNCQHPEKLKDKPGKCTPEQIRECHGSEEAHSCEEKKEEK